MLRDYQIAILKDYQRKKAGNMLSQRLVNPTPAQLKDECIAVCEERYLKAERHLRKDEETLRIFFGRKDSLEAYIQAIRKHETDKFKPLANYLKGGLVKNTEDKNNELLAWLIDFEPRPYSSGETYVEDKSASEGTEKTGQEVTGHDATDPAAPEPTENIGQEVTTPDVDTTGTPPSLSERHKYKLKIRDAIIYTLIIICISTGTYWLLNRKVPKVVLHGDEKCMYWTGDHYQPISCNEKVSDDTLVIALDSGKLNHFKKITEPDTITGNAKGYVWYIKVDDGIEFYTSDGVHPTHLEKRLRPLTDYIIYKYVRHK